LIVHARLRLGSHPNVPTGRDMSAVLDVVRGPIAFGGYVVPFVEERVESLKDRAVFFSGLVRLIESPLFRNDQVCFLHPHRFHDSALRRYVIALSSPICALPPSTNSSTSVTKLESLRSQKQRPLRNFVGLPPYAHRNGGHNPRHYVWRLPTRQWRS
jgi:hypothetical protein